MIRLGLAAVIVTAFFAVAAMASPPPSAALSSPAPTAEAVQALVARAAAHVLRNGRLLAFADFSRPDGGFVEGDLYVFCSTDEGIVLAHGGNPKLVGKDLASVRDAEGREPITELARIARTKGQGWLEYLWPNAATGRIQRKVAYVVLIDNDAFCGSGYYQPSPP